ncbi:DNA-methyltransferase [Pandoraea apista]|uniref:DNA-methyltransferase n=1 Tax=Pandoraea apista TaxID=93218 RepID=UPI00058A91EE|nr:hypothetical protein SG18_18005 [Pandoraea apista]AKH73744.1 hypothetical protein XM39_18195 [Pandoraea apista]AKI62292.1 hypothetical protein AA956_11510 [Pandoraea apista]
MRIDQCYFGDCRDSMRAMIAAGGGRKVQTIVTSPPYWGLRDYGNPLGIWGGDPACEHAFDMERTEHEHRTGLGLADLGEKYAGGGHKQGKIGSIAVEQGTCPKCGAWRGALGHEPTPQLFVDHLVEVFRHARDLLADDGTLWLNLGDSYASKPNGPKASASCALNSQAHGKWRNEHGQRSRGLAGGLKHKDLVGIPWRVALALQDDGWYLRQDIIWHKPNPMPESVADRCTKAHEYLFLLSKSDRYYFDNEAIKEPARYTGLANQDASGFKNPMDFNGKHAHSDVRGDRGSKRNSFARVTKDSAGEHGQKPQFRPDREDVDYAGLRNKRSVWTVATEGYSGAHFAVFPPALIEPCILAGSRPGDIVLDPFLGSGTTAQVSQALGRHWVGCELNQEYSSLQEARTRQRGLMLTVEGACDA